MYNGVATGGDGLNRYAAGNKVYGSGRPMPTVGRVDPMGYRERDAKLKTQQSAILSKLRAMLTGNYASPDANRVIR
jgi:hypothetical protein